ncbi:MAG: DUF2281 domain-containing protein [Spirochaetota bacterium]
MSYKSILIKEIKKLPEPVVAEVLDYVRFLEYKNQRDFETYIQSESSLAKEWLSPIEDEAWKNL